MKHALRSLAKSPGFTIVAVLTLALGIGLNTAMFSGLNAFVLRPLSFPEPDRLFFLQRTTPQQPERRHAAANFLDLARDSADVATLAGYRDWAYTLSEPDRPAELLYSFRVSAGFFEVLGVQPELGRGFRADEDQPGRNHVIVLSHDFWQSRYGGDPAVIGRVVRIDGAPTEIIGVLPASAAAPTLWGRVTFFCPIGLSDEERVNRADGFCDILGRYREGVSATQGAARFAALGARLARDHPKENGGSGERAVPMQDANLGNLGTKLTFVLLGLSGFVLLIACANLANLLLARTIARMREFAVRAALGASRLHLVRPIATECALLTVGGGALSMLVASWASVWMARRFTGGDLPLEFPLDWRVLAFAFAASLATGLFFGIAPAWLISRLRVNETLKSGARGSTGDRSQHRFRQILIVGQFALALVLLAGAGLFVRGIDSLLQREAGWNPAPLVRGIVYLGNYQDPVRLMGFYDQLRERLGALPGVEATAVSFELPAFQFPGPRGFVVEGRDAPPTGHEPTAFVNGVTPGYFDTVGTRLLRGRDFAVTDREGSPRAVIINEAMARALFPEEDAIGRRLGRTGENDPQWMEIVGVVEDVRFLNIAPSPIRFQVYKPLAQETWSYVSVTLRSTNGSAPESLVEPFRRVVAELDPDLPVRALLPVTKFVDNGLSWLHAINGLLIGFAALGLFLAALGIYGVIAHLVAQRTNEIGIRMALGAGLGDVVRLVLGAGLRLTFAGAAIGLLGAAGLARFLHATLPGIATGATAPISAAIVVLIGIALLACWLPARRATKVDPLTALRAE